MSYAILGFFGLVVVALIWRMANMSKELGEVRRDNEYLRGELNAARKAIDAYRDPLPDDDELLDWVRNDSGVKHPKV